MSIDKPGGGSDSAPDRPRKPEHPVPRPDNPAARERPASSAGADAPAARPDRGADAEAHRLARLARRAEAARPEAPRPEAHRPETPPRAQPEAPTEAPRAPREARPGDKGVITHFHGPTLDLYTDGTRWASGDVVRAREAERTREAERSREAERDRKTGPTTDVPVMRDYGRSVIGDRPNDAADLPPDRKELMESDDSKRSRGDRLRRDLEDEEVLGDAHDTIHDQGNLIQRSLDSHQPQGHPMQVQRDTPQAGPVQHGQTSAGDIAMTGLMVGIMLDKAVQSARNIWARRKEVD